MKYEKFTVEIELGNVAMMDLEDVARALRRIADRLDAGSDGGKVMDTNGNAVGTFSAD